MSVHHPDPDRLALAALPAEAADPEINEHLGGCVPCREHVAGLRRTVELARTDHADSATPPPRVWQAIVDELDELDGMEGDPTRADVARTPQAQPQRAVRSRRRRGWRAVAVPVAAAVAGVAAGVGIGFGLAPSAVPPPAGTQLAQLQPIGGADPAAAGTVDEVPVDGSRELVIDVRGVTDTAGGDYLEAWLIDPLGTRLVSLGALTRTPDGGYHGDFTVPAELPMNSFNTVDISAERWDGDPSHSRISLLRGSMT